jgi:hypothetical protein
MTATTRCEVSCGERLALLAISGRVCELFPGGEGEPPPAQDARHLRTVAGSVATVS